jgi:hypothetical protein
MCSRSRVRENGRERGGIDRMTANEEKAATSGGRRKSDSLYIRSMQFAALAALILAPGRIFQSKGATVLAVLCVVVASVLVIAAMGLFLAGRRAARR